MRALFRIVVGILAAAGAAALAAGLWLAAGDISARAAPGRFETAVARRMRSIAIPSGARERRNPGEQTPQTLRSGLEHFADHCASCHANDGSGDTEMGRSMYPPAPDMRRAATQELTDGELFYIIENGVRFTGMPAWSTGTPAGEASSWHLVQFVRHLPRLGAAEIEDMKTLNPRTAAEWREEEEIRRFLSGEGETPRPKAPQHEHGGDR